MLKKIGWWTFWAFVVYFVVTNPQGAANLANGIGHWFTHAAGSASQFAGNLGHR